MDPEPYAISKARIEHGDSSWTGFSLPIGRILLPIPTPGAHPMTDQELLDAIDDHTTLALTAWGEARQIPRADPDSHSPVEELIAVMCVVRNRVQRDGHARSYKAICLAPQQFSCWNPGSGHNHDRVMEQARALVEQQAIDVELGECLFLATGIIGGQLLDHTNGATHYWAPAAMVPPGRIPSWAQGTTPLRIGDQLFVRLA